MDEYFDIYIDFMDDGTFTISLNFLFFAMTGICMCSPVLRKQQDRFIDDE